MRIESDWIGDEALQAVLACLTKAGHRTLLVGGCVRNALMGRAIDDIDIATDARPDRVVALAEEAGLKVVPTGIDHGTVTIVAGGRPHEVTSFRRDVETDGRRATVAYSDDIAEDAARRDFTMNALYAEGDGTVIDPLGGLPDLLARRVRFVGRPEDRIREDYLRILRFFRFHAIYGDPAGGIDPDGLAAAAALSAGIGTLSRERVGHEMRKLLGAADPAPALAAMEAAGVLARVLPGAAAAPLARLVAVEAGARPDWLRRLALLGGADAGDALRLSRDEARRLVVLRDGIGAATGPGELAWRHGPDAARDILALRFALLEQPVPPGAAQEIAAGTAARFPVRAADLPDLSGPALGRRLKDLEARWIASGFILSREQLLA
ncbi:CCA tRNA nucleotidyltransferase [Frigidibacter sp. RF13]|uniref:CCA tRNA nucleotidyltransferase n=1 Tax=Frigidibacter sp. RF13 TaxID=2997340 RepID=UPI0022714EAA|nr:CCA tRNA nucleotidyltransferase [Frigidibacter sp. RF13]MCY1126741.1 CCA tRNA nucleotidyltransferase [Frigidibacter sp. RF13]